MPKTYVNKKNYWKNVGFLIGTILLKESCQKHLFYEAGDKELDSLLHLPAVFRVTPCISVYIAFSCIFFSFSDATTARSLGFIMPQKIICVDQWQLYSKNNVTQVLFMSNRNFSIFSNQWSEILQKPSTCLVKFDRVICLILDIFHKLRPCLFYLTPSKANNWKAWTMIFDRSICIRLLRPSLLLGSHSFTV